METVSLVPELTVRDSRAAIAFYQKAFGATPGEVHTTPDGKKVMHASVQLNGAWVMLADDFPEHNGGKSRSAQALGGSPVTLHLNVSADIDGVWKRAVDAGATVLLPLADQFWGARYGILQDPFGQRWSMSSEHSEKKVDTSSAEYIAGAESQYPTK